MWAAIALLAASCSADDGESEVVSSGQRMISGDDLAHTVVSYPCIVEPPDHPNVTCAQVTVPENRSGYWNTRTISLPVVVFHATAANPRPDPVIYLEGGPGGSAIADLDALYARFIEQLAVERDVVVFDQRGSGFSQPSLACGVDPTAEMWIGEATLVESAKLCRSRLAASNEELGAYRAAESAADVVDIATALGYESWNLLGVSYGSRLGLTVMRDHPDGLRSVVLDSVYPPQVDAAGESRRRMAEATMAFIAACERDPVCADRFPDLATRLADLADSLDRTPWTEAGVTFDGFSLMATVESLLTRAETASLIPLMLEATERRDFQAFGQVLSPVFAFGDDFSFGAFLAQICTDEVPFTRGAKPLTVAPPFDRLPLQGSWYIAACDEFLNYEPDPIENEPVSSDLPVLMLAGALDPITPASWAHSTAETLPNSTVVVLDHVSHNVLRYRCSVDLAEEFFGLPRAPLTSSCEFPFLLSDTAAQ